MGAEATVPNDDAIASAADAGLRWVSDTAPGIRRRMERGKPVYFDSAGKRVTDQTVLGVLYKF